MKKLLLMILPLLFLTGCEEYNYDYFDTVYKYNKAVILLQNGDVIEVDVLKWADYDGEQIQVTAKDGTVYLTSSFNCTLIKEPVNETK